MDNSYPQVTTHPTRDKLKASMNVWLANYKDQGIGTIRVMRKLYTFDFHQNIPLNLSE